MADNKEFTDGKPADGTPDPGSGSNLPVALDSALLPLKKVGQDAGEGDETQGKEDPVLRIIPVRNTVLFPHNIVPIAAGKDWSLESIQAVMRSGRTVGVLTTREATKEGDATPLPNELFEVGTEAKVLKVIRFPDNSAGAVLQGVRRFRVQRFLESKNGGLTAEVRFFENEAEARHPSEDLEMLALGRSLKQLVHKAISLSPNIPPEAAVFIENVQDPAYLADLVVPYLTIDVALKQELLEYELLSERLRKVHFFLTRELEVLEISQKIHSEVRSEVGKQQRRYYVKEQMRLLQKELGEIDGKEGQTGNDPTDLRARVEKSAMPQMARDAALKEVDRLSMMQSGSPEYMVSYTYVNWLLDVPWGVTTQGVVDLKKAKAVLDDDHFGLEKVKKRILEFLAVYSLKKNLKGPIVLLVGPPGVGKTSLGKSVAKALGRKFVRIALGGVRDEAEIRGHRRTYIGSMPGKFVDALKRAGSMDPVILLDEVDKVAADFRGDPSSALLEVLDSEQNHTFTDHYLNVPVDLSQVLFIATANTLQTIQGPLRDRMEVLELSGYTLDEKTNIASRHLLPQVLDDHGLADKTQVEISSDGIKDVIQNYTREAGVRDLRRQLATLARNVALEWVEKNPEAVRATAKTKHSKPRKPARRVLTKKDVEKFLGPAPYLESMRPKVLPVGVATGLAYTPVGGDVLFIETVRVEDGQGRLALTGQLGDVMKESAQTAQAYILANAKACGLDVTKIKKLDVHIHFPAGAVKKDGPSAGVAIFLALLGQYLQKPIRSDIAVTGEISLRGEVLPVGGIKEKLLAAHRYGIKDVLIPKLNAKDLIDIPKEVLKDMRVHTIARMDEALRFALLPSSPKRK